MNILRWLTKAFLFRFELGGGSSSGSTTTVQKADPWSGVQPYMTYGFQQAQNLLNAGGPYYYPGQQVASFQPAQTATQELTAARAIGGSPLQTAAQGEATNTLNGDYLSAGNPYFQQMVNTQITPAVKSGVDSSFEGSGRYGSGAWSNALASGLSNAVTNAAYQNYNDERTRQAQAQYGAPALAGMDYTNLSALGDVGNQQQAQAQNEINAAMNQWNYNQNLPYQKLGQYEQYISGNYPNSISTTQPYFTNPAAGALGGAMAGYSLMSGANGLGSALGLGSMAGPIGAIGGGLLGLLL